MKIKIIITLFIIAIIGWYVIGLIGNPFIFIISSVLLTLFFMSLVYFLTTVLVMKLIPSNRKKFYETHKMQLRIIILFCFAFFSFGCWTINKYLLPEMFHLIGLFG